MKYLVSKAAPGIWKPTGEVKSIFDGKKRHMDSVKISWYYFYYYYYGRDKSSLKTIEWPMREYYLTFKYLPPNKVKRKNGLFTMMIKIKELKGSNNDNQGKSDEEMQMIQSLQGRLQLDLVRMMLSRGLSWSIRPLSIVFTAGELSVSVGKCICINVKLKDSKGSHV
ncbi:hypothetical protein RDI58_020452 [Solanum bulbocastanum]|uniref:NAC domain-containing protein n=1 Tax=Solanum bulbocastanum TaxID=147425 RepID=A0AAN8TC44_SOLBU